MLGLQFYRIDERCNSLLLQRTIGFDVINHLSSREPKVGSTKHDGIEVPHKLVAVAEIHGGGRDLTRDHLPRFVVEILITGTANLLSFSAPYFIGWVRAHTDGFSGASLVMAI